MTYSSQFAATLNTSANAVPPSPTVPFEMESDRQIANKLREMGVDIDALQTSLASTADVSPQARITW